MSEENKAIYLRGLKEYFEGGDEAVLEALYPDNHVNHFLGVNGAEAWKQFNVPFREGFTGLHFTVHFQMADEDKVLNCWTAQATHSGDLMGIPASGKEVSFNGMSVGRIEDGKVVEEWTVLDMFGLLQQLGAIPPVG
jgi:steroid delta-isomerase-like uncharacterized protein